MLRSSIPRQPPGYILGFVNATTRRTFTTTSSFGTVVSSAAVSSTRVGPSVFVVETASALRRPSAPLLGRPLLQARTASSSSSSSATESGGAAAAAQDPGAATSGTTLAHILPSQQAPKGIPRVVVLGSGWAGFQLVRGMLRRRGVTKKWQGAWVVPAESLRLEGFAEEPE